MGKEKAVGELRQDLVTGKWVIIATERAKRPQELVTEKEEQKIKAKYKEDCPFCNLADFPQEPDTLRIPDDPDNWQFHIFGNKFPALKPADEFRSWSKGPYHANDAIGYHELLATRWHNERETDITQPELSLMIEALVLRYRALKKQTAVNYIQIMRNHGEAAGASLAHPHLQIFTTPVLPSDVQDLLFGAEKYANQTGREVFADIVQYEEETGDRVVYKNDKFIAYCPFASRVPFEVVIMPTEPSPYFEDLGPSDRDLLSEIMQQVLRRLDGGLKDPALNYFIHSAPCDTTGFVCDSKLFQNFRWHLSIQPRFGQFGGFEMASGLEINHTPPEVAAGFLRDVKLVD